MYTVSVETTFSATHSVAMPDGTAEPRHGHDWRVRVFLASEQLNAFSMVVDFEVVRSALETVLAPWQHRDLNNHEDFANLSPTAEVVAKTVYDKLQGAGITPLARIQVTECPGCIAQFEP